ncbi:MAG: site-2 protease family protein [Tepidisphaerales bacterium]
MAFQDRPYYRDRDSGPTGNPAMWLLVGSVPLFTLFGVRVRMHASMIVYIGVELLTSSGGLGAKNTLTAMAILFISVLLHEFGHIFGARIMGGHGDDILMWPLGGLAHTAPPHRPWPSFVSTACGPLVNILICIVTGTLLVVLSHSAGAIPWFPLTSGLKSFIPTSLFTYYLFWIFLVNYALAAFNLTLVFYPFDGGRMIQELLWFKVGYYKSMMFATMVGMIGAIIAAMVGVVTLNFWLVLIAGFGFYTCMQQRQMLKAAGPGEFEEEGLYSAAYEVADRPGWWARRRASRAAAAERGERRRVDEILAKVSAHGMLSLSWREKRALRQATEHQRERDAGRRKR